MIAGSPQAGAWSMAEEDYCPDIQASPSGKSELSVLASYCVRGDVEKLNAALNVQPADLELSCQTASREFREGESIRAKVSLRNRSTRPLRFLNLSEERLTGRSYLSQGVLRDDYLIRPKLPAKGVAVVQPGAQLEIPIVLEVEGVGPHHVGVALLRPEWRSVGGRGSEISSKVISRTKCAFDIIR